MLLKGRFADLSFLSNKKIMDRYIKKFSEIGLNDLAEVGGKNASLGEMFRLLGPKGIQVPDGFAVTAAAFKYFIEKNGLKQPLDRLMEQLDRKSYGNLPDIGRQARQLLLSASLPDDLQLTIFDAYDEIFNFREAAVAVRSSATAEDLPDASFAGQH